MHEVKDLLPADAPAAVIATVTLTFDQRRKSRQRLCLPSGDELALFLPRGTGLRDGDRLLIAEGRCVLVSAAPEPLSTVATTNEHLLNRAAYHLGNRHVALQILPGELRYQHDHVLDDLVRALGIVPGFVNAPFQPETGPYSAGGHRHDHDHGDDHDHDDHHHHHAHT